MILVRHGETITECKTIYINDDDCLEFRIKYKSEGKYNTWQYGIENYNFIITDSEVKVNREIINIINDEISKRINKTTIKFKIDN